MHFSTFDLFINPPPYSTKFTYFFQHYLDSILSLLGAVSFLAEKAHSSLLFYPGIHRAFFSQFFDLHKLVLLTPSKPQLFIVISKIWRNLNKTVLVGVLETLSELTNFIFKTQCILNIRISHFEQEWL